MHTPRKQASTAGAGGDERPSGGEGVAKIRRAARARHGSALALLPARAVLPALAVLAALAALASASLISPPALRAVAARAALPAAPAASASTSATAVTSAAAAAPAPARQAPGEEPPPPPDEPPLALLGGRIYTSPEALPIEDGILVLDRGKIAAVGPRGSVAVAAGSREIDCKGLVITAGFQNSHVHFTEDKWMGAAGLPAAVLAEQLAAMLTRYGFTTVVDTASSLANTNALRRRIASGEVAGPRILTAGEGIYPPDGVPYYVRNSIPAEVVKLLPQPATARAARDVVDAHVRDGADITKLFTGSWVQRGRVLPMPAEVADAAAEEAHRHHMLVFSHPSNLAGLEVAIHAHVDVLAHVLDDARGLTLDHLKRMRAQNMAVIPTLKLFGRPPFLFELLDEVRNYVHLGGQILFGTDVGYLTDYDPTTEYELLESAGLGWRDILATLTTAPAERFGEGARRGRIAPGMDADIVALAADPAARPSSFVEVRYTIRGGRVIYPVPGGGGESRPPG